MLKVSFKNYDENLENILKFMYPLWHEVYKDIIPEKQIDFLLDKYFDVQSIKSYLKDIDLNVSVDIKYNLSNMDYEIGIQKI